jgi:MYXO-CTERM domain-containing protein
MARSTATHWIHWIIAAVAIAFPGSALAAPGQGTPDDPVVIDQLPWFQRGDTTVATSDAIDAYSCDMGLDESGHEWIYRFELPADARVTAWIEGDGAVVDNDVHLLDDLSLDGAVATSCVARGHTIAEADLTAGTRFVVVDAFDGEAQAGAFVLRLYAVGSEWSQVPVGEGVVWRARRFADDDGAQVQHVLDLDLSVPGVAIEVYDPPSCMTVTQAADAVPIRPVAAVNSSFFSFDGVCSPNSFMKHDGVVLADSVGEGAFGLAEDGTPMVAMVPAGADWPQVHEGQGGRGLLVEDGVAKSGSDWNDQGLSADFAGTHPRTIAGYRDDGTVVLGTVDGRHANAAGKTLDSLAAYARGELACEGAVNWDGGGSTQMWVGDMTPNGVVNYPSDAGPEQSDHTGARSVGGVVFVHADPYNWLPRFQTEPPLDTAVGEDYAYDADAVDMNVDDVIAWSLIEAPEGMTIDAVTGEIAMMPTASSPAVAMVIVRASDGHGGDADQAFELQIDGGVVGGDDGASSDGGDDTGDDTGATSGDSAGLDDGAGSDGDATDAAADGDGDAGCGCRSGRGGRDAPLGLLSLLGLLVLRRRSRDGLHCGACGPYDRPF